MDLVENDLDMTNGQEGTETAADLKAKMHQNGDVRNHIDVSHQNGDDSMSNHVNEKPVKSERDSSPSKHHSSSSKHSSSHSSSSKSKDHHSSSSSSKHSSSSSNKHKDGSSSGKSHHSSSSSSSKHKDGSSSSSSKHKDGSSSSSSSKPKDGSSSHSSSSKHKSSSEHKSSSSSSSDKHKDRSKDGSSSDKHKDRHKEGSSSDKHKDRSKDGHSSSSDKHKERSKDGHSSSSDKHKERSKYGHSSSSDKHKERSKDGEHKSKSSSSSHSSSDKHKHSSKPKESSSEGKSKEVKTEIKKEPTSPTKASSPSKSPRKEIKSEDEFSPKKTEIKEEPTEEPMSDDDVPLSVRAKDVTPSTKRAAPESDDDDEPLSARVEKVKKKIKKEEKPDKPAKKRKQEDSDDEKPVKKKKIKKESETSPPEKGKKKKKKEGEEGQPEVWRWWEEETREDGVKWNYLEHKGPIFAPEYEPMPDSVKFYYDGKPMKLSPETEEVATFYGRMLDHDYTTKDVFNKNFFKDWRKVMTQSEKEKITDLKKCRFNEINDYFKLKSEERKNRSREEKKAEKLKNDEIQKEYGVCVFDGHKEKIGNFRIEPPGLFRGRGEHPKQGMLKKRIQPEDVIINCSKNSDIPQPPKGHKWKEVRHDNKVSWLACWTENIQGQTKYVMLNAASRLKGEKDWQKYETARKLHKIANNIRENYRNDWKSKEMRIRQRAVALYFIDKLALRAGNEKEEGETADTVGCCSLRVEHINLHEKYDDQEYVVEFDFLGKDSIRYYNRVPVEKRAFKNLQLFTENKQPGDDLFDRLNTAILNKHLHDLMPGLTAKVFRTYNASKTLQEQLNLLTEEEDNVNAKLLSYNRANRAVAILCNHQRAVPKNFDKQMENLQTKIDAKKDAIKDAKKQVKAAKADYKATKATKAKQILDKKKKMMERLEEQLVKLEVQATDKDENKEIALGTSKLNYLDPRISVAWCKKWEVPIEKIYNKTQRDKFRWAIDMADEDYQF